MGSARFSTKLFANCHPPQSTVRGHFFAVAAEAMRRIFVENARRKRSLKAGRDRIRVDLDDAEVTLNQAPDDVLALDDALAMLARENPAEKMLQMLDG